MPYPTSSLPDISSIGGTWTVATLYDSLGGYPVGRAMFDGHEWPFEPAECPYNFNNRWFLDGGLLLCMACGVDGT